MVNRSCIVRMRTSSTVHNKLLQALLEHWPKTHIFEGQGKNVKFSIHIAKKVIMRYIEIEQS
jgi:predicted DNA-binding ArsR family transcriptional regulator